MTDFVLAHSPHGGAYTWQPTAELLRSRGHRVALPTFRSTPTRSYWERNVNAILRSARSDAVIVALVIKRRSLLSRSSAVFWSTA